MRALWNGVVVAESDDTVEVEGNRYFPARSVKRRYLAKSGETYECPWKGHADYYDVTVAGATAKNGAFVYPNPKPAAENIRGRFAFWNGVEVLP